MLSYHGPVKRSRRNLPAPHSAPPDQSAYLAASARAQRQQHRHAARGAPDRIRLERLSPPSFRDSWEGELSEPDRLHHVRDRREERTSLPIPFPRHRALSLQYYLCRLVAPPHHIRRYPTRLHTEASSSIWLT